MPNNLSDFALDAVIPLDAGSSCALGLISVSGADAVSFLQGQLTQDVQALPEGQARWAGYCSPKGRLSATGRLWRTQDQIWWAVSGDLTASLAKRLSMFVLRAKAKVEDKSSQWMVLGIMGPQAHREVAGWLQLQEIPVLGPDEVKAQTGAVMWVGLPAVQLGPEPKASHPRSMLFIGREQIDTLPEAWRHSRSPNQSASWKVAEVLSAIPRITAQTADCFVPQMVNFESVDGVSFTKGCYPGQEVVARSQYLGKLRRRMFVAQGQGLPPAPASDILAEGQAEPVGQVVMSASAGDGFVLLFECRTDLAVQGSLRTSRAGDSSDGAEGSLLRLLPLPYALKAQE